MPEPETTAPDVPELYTRTHTADDLLRLVKCVAITRAALQDQHYPEATLVELDLQTLRLLGDDFAIEGLAA